MRALSAAELLAAWDRGCLEQPVDRPLALLAASCDEPVANLAAASLGRRDALLLALREHTFGPWLNGLATCPGCDCELEVPLTVDDVRVPGSGTDQPAAPLQQLVAGGYELEIRLPDSRDASAAAAATAAAGDRRSVV